MSEKSKDERNGQSIVSAPSPSSDVKKAGVLRKLKTMKKKYFVLRTESDSGPARLEYYDSEKKYKSGAAPKRSISIKKCFNINRKVDAKQKLAIALYTKDDCFSVVAETEQFLEEWLKAMLELQLDDTCLNGTAALKPKFEHVWQVSIGEKSLACTRNMRGHYRLCLTNSSLTLVKMDQSDNPETLEFPLMSIRRCGHSNNYFLIELGRSSITGAGELWLETEDVVIAQNMHEVTLNAMKSCREHEDMGSHRPRSSSNSETSRPIATRRPVAVVSAQPNPYPSVRDRCDSMPSRPRTISEGQEINSRSYYTSPSHPLESLRSHSGFPRTVSYSPPGISNPLSPSSTVCSTDSAGSSLSIDEYDGGQSDFTHGRYPHSMPADNTILIEPAIKEEQLDDYLPMSGKGVKETSGYVHMAASNAYSSSAPSGPSMYLSLNPTENSTSSISRGSDYMDMASPVSPPGDYLPMSPLGNKTIISDADIVRNTPVVTTSITKPPEGYLYMAPAASASNVSVEGYLDMAPLSSSLPKASALSTSASRFNCQGGNGAIETTVASDVVKPEVYHLDKVKSLLTQTDDTSEDYIRPVRAYSMGSRPQPKKTHLSIHNDGARIRAYSVGSQAVSMRNKTLSSADHDLGSLKRIDVRAGGKSSSAPLLHNRPPRMRSSASRGDVGEDLMEIDYNKGRHLMTGLNLRDSEFTIEPVGRSRSGSYSSGSFADKVDRRNKLVHERDKTVHHSASPIIKSPECIDGYMPMSPSWVSSKPTAQNTHPSGDYVSLNPSIRYSSLGKNNKVNPVKTLPGSNAEVYHRVTIEPASPYLGVSTHNMQTITGCDKFNNIQLRECSPPSYTERNITCNVAVGDSLECSCTESKTAHQPDTCMPNTSDYTCTNCEKDSADISNCISVSNVAKAEQNSRPSSTGSVKSELLDVCGPLSCSTNKGISGMENSESVSKLNGVRPEAPANPNASVTLVGEQPSSNMVHSSLTPCPVPMYEGLQLNYASLDLPPSDNDDVTLIMPVHRLRLAANVETKEVPLTYAQIDFSSPRSMPETFKDSLSHL